MKQTLQITAVLIMAACLFCFFYFLPLIAWSLVGSIIVLVAIMDKIEERYLINKERERLERQI